MKWMLIVTMLFTSVSCVVDSGEVGPSEVHVKEGITDERVLIDTTSSQTNEINSISFNGWTIENINRFYLQGEDVSLKLKFESEIDCDTIKYYCGLMDENSNPIQSTLQHVYYPSDFANFTINTDDRYGEYIYEFAAFCDKGDSSEVFKNCRIYFDVELDQGSIDSLINEVGNDPVFVKIGVEFNEDSKQ